MAGAISSSMHFSEHFKNQCANLGSPFSTYAFSIDEKFKGKNWKNKYIDIGGILVSDKAGDLNYKRFMGDFSAPYHQKLNSTQYFSIRIKLGLIQHSMGIMNA